MPTNLPGGRILAGIGGYTNVISPFNGTMTRLDLLTWDITRDIRLWRRGHSGTLGAIVSRQVGYDWFATGTGWWDIANPPETTMGSGWGCGVQFGIGSAAGQASYGATQQQFYLAPAAMLSLLHVHDSSEGEEADGVVTFDYKIMSNALLFLLRTSSRPTTPT